MAQNNYIEIYRQIYKINHIVIKMKKKINIDLKKKKI